MIDKLLKLLEKIDFTQEDIYNTFTLEERKTITRGKEYDTAFFLNACQERKLVLLTPDEAMKMILENPNEEVLVDTLADYLNQDQIFELTLKNGFNLATYRLTKAEYVVRVIEEIAMLKIDVI